jgi:hypothetical protein
MNKPTQQAELVVTGALITADVADFMAHCAARLSPDMEAYVAEVERERDAAWRRGDLLQALNDDLAKLTDGYMDECDDARQVAADLAWFLKDGEVTATGRKCYLCGATWNFVAPAAHAPDCRVLKGLAWRTEAER